MTTLPTDVKELTPEFYCDPAFLLNARRLDFGTRASGAQPCCCEGMPKSQGAWLVWSMACRAYAQLCCAAATTCFWLSGVSTGACASICLSLWILI